MILSKASRKKILNPVLGQINSAYAELRRKIIDCEIAPGAIVSEPMLTELLGFQKAAVRSALTKLAHDGLLRAVPRQGYEVEPLTVEDALDLIEMRAITEPRAAYFAAGRLDPTVLQKAEKLFKDGCDTSSTRAVTAFLHDSREFKRTVAESSGNKSLASSVIEISQRFDRYLRWGFTEIGLQDSGNDEALALVAALQAQDPERSAQAMRLILQRVGRSIIEGLLAQEISHSWRPARSTASRDSIIDEVLGPRLQRV